MIPSKSRWLPIAGALMLVVSLLPGPVNGFAQGDSRTFPERSHNPLMLFPLGRLQTGQVMPASQPNLSRPN